MFTIGITVFISDNDQLKVAGTDYVNVKSVRPVCVCVATMLQKTKKHKVRLRNFRILLILKIYPSIYLHIGISILNIS